MMTGTTLGSPKIGQFRDAFLRSDAARRLAAEDLSRLRKFVTWCGVSTSIEAVPPFKIEQFLAEQTKTSQPPRLYVPVLRAFFAYAHQQGAVEQDPMKVVRLPRGTGGTRKSTGPMGNGSPAAETISESAGTDGSAGSGGADVVFVSRAQHESMQADLERLRTHERHRISQMLHEAIKDGDLSENAAYDDAKMRQGMLEARIRELESKLRNVRLIEDQVNRHGVGIGSRVQLEELASGEVLDYQVVGPEETNPRGGKISHRSPVGQAIMGKLPGAEVEVATPGGPVRFRIVSVK
ncbi:MAG TPA: transcription elongation factor GreA [Candidatus Tectomicrobia bacterium]|nr:transcription elongation factor GreA [Candidatus Tectomicrobia bacterium]